MRTVEVAGVTVSAIGLGTWQFSGDWGYGLEWARTTAPALVRRALELGVTLIDTAEAYGGGASELIGGSALRDDIARDPFVATKLTPILPIPSVVLGHAERSRRRLRLSAIDLYQLHFPNPLVPIGIQAAALRRVLDRGVARHVGVSNHSLRRWQAIERALGRPALSNQVELSLARPGPLRELVPYAAAHDRLVIAYSPLGQGYLTDGHHPRRRNAARMIRRALGCPGPDALRGVREMLSEVARAHPGATMAQVALAWVISHPNVVAIPGARTLEQLESNVRAADLALTADEIDRLTAAAFATARR
ncbi:MAG TPA: aldo/keto reductase [Candidatus Limnocylindrales bacterium]